MPLEGQLPCLQEHWKQQVECDYAAQAHAACDDLVGIAVLGDIVDDPRVRKSKNFPDSKIFTKTFRIKCVNRDIDDFATNARKT